MRKKEELLNQKQALFKGIEKTSYVLKGIIIHEGNPNFGHYTGYVK